MRLRNKVSPLSEQVSFRGYHDLIALILKDGEDTKDRTGVGTKRVFAKTLEFDLRLSFPILQTKKIHFKSVLHELLWFISGNTNIKYLKDNSVRIWDEWADENGDLGRVYGAQWRTWRGHDGKIYDQLSDVITELRANPYGRRHVVSAWNPSEIENMALPPCHMMFQFYVNEEKELSCQIYQRSADLFLGVPFNISSYALLTHFVAAHCGFTVGKLHWVGGDVHIYNNHIVQCREMLRRSGIPHATVPKIEVKPEEGMSYINIFKITAGSVSLYNYTPMPALKGEVAV